MSTDHRDLGEHIRSERRKERGVYREELIKSAVKHGNRALAEKDWAALVAIICERLYPALKLDEYNIHEYHSDVQGRPLDWYWDDTYVFVNDPVIDEWLTYTSSYEGQNTLTRIFLSLQSAAVVEGVVDAELSRELPVYGYKLQLGRRWLPWMATRKDEQVLRSLDHSEMVIAAGAHGSGKSTAGQAEAEDHVAHGNKLIDLHDQSKAENALYDVEEQDDVLIDVREEMGLSTGFDAEYPRPGLEIYVPMTKSLDGLELPCNTETDEFVVKPFAIPASEIPKEGLVLMVDQTDAQQKYLRIAYEKVDRELDDWTLQDLSNAVYETNARADVADRIRASLEVLQHKGYIRDKKSSHLLDWEEIFRDPSVITSFTVSLMDDEVEKLVVMHYLLEKIINERRRLARENSLGDYPMLSVVLREIQKLAPSQNKRSEDARKASIQSATTATLQEYGEDLRHARLEILADCQKFKAQLDNDVRGHADRVYAFKGQVDDVYEAFKTRVLNSRGLAATVSQYPTGQCALLNEQGYTMPIQMAPPRSMHLDTKTYSNGFIARVTVLDDEEMREVPWDVSVPSRLVFEEQIDVDDADLDSATYKFAAACIDEADDGRAFTVDLHDAYRVWAITNGEDLAVNRQKLMEDIIDFYELDSDNDKTRPKYHDGSRKNAYKGIRLNERGLDYLDRDDERHNLDEVA